MQDPTKRIVTLSDAYRALGYLEGITQGGTRVAEAVAEIAEALEDYRDLFDVTELAVMARVQLVPVFEPDDVIREFGGNGRKLMETPAAASTELSMPEEVESGEPANAEGREAEGQRPEVGAEGQKANPAAGAHAGCLAHRPRPKAWCADCRAVCEIPEGRECRDCGQWKPWDQFDRNSENKWGYTGRCAECRRKLQRKSKPHPKPEPAPGSRFIAYLDAEGQVWYIDEIEGGRFCAWCRRESGIADCVSSILEDRWFPNREKAQLALDEFARRQPKWKALPESEHPLNIAVESGS